MVREVPTQMVPYAESLGPLPLDPSKAASGSLLSAEV